MQPTAAPWAAPPAPVSPPTPVDPPDRSLWNRLDPARQRLVAHCVAALVRRALAAAPAERIGDDPG